MEGDDGGVEHRARHGLAVRGPAHRRVVHADHRAARHLRAELRRLQGGGGRVADVSRCSTSTFDDSPISAKPRLRLGYRRLHVDVSREMREGARRPTNLRWRVRVSGEVRGGG